MEYTKEKEQKKYDTLLKECRVFWAFNEEQLKQGIKENPIEKGEKYTSFGGGGYMPKKNFKAFDKGMGSIAKWKKESKKDDKAVILYELNNYECFYTGEIDENAWDSLKSLGFSVDQVKRVFNANKEELAC